VGFKTFTVGEVLTAADVNAFLMKQTLIVCTSSTRPSSPAEGWHIYETDTNKILVYDGAAWEVFAQKRIVPQINVFTGSGTYNKPTDAFAVHVRLVGGGGGGAGAGATSGSQAAAGGGGGVAVARERTAAATPLQVPMAQEWSPPRTSGNAPRSAILCTRRDRRAHSPRTACVASDSPSE